MNSDSQRFFQTVTGSLTSEMVVDFFDEFAAQHAARSGEEIKNLYRYFRQYAYRLPE